MAFEKFEKKKTPYEFNREKKTFEGNFGEENPEKKKTVVESGVSQLKNWMHERKENREWKGKVQSEAREQGRNEYKKQYAEEYKKNYTNRMRDQAKRDASGGHSAFGKIASGFKSFGNSYQGFVKSGRDMGLGNMWSMGYGQSPQRTQKKKHHKKPQYEYIRVRRK